MIYELSELFYSIQGEGLLQGLPMVFVRLAGCNLRCNFCDTGYAWGKGRRKDVRRIVKEIERYSCKRVCITGGEPYLQNLSPLVDTLKQKKYWIAVETNGTIWQELSIDWVTVSPKKEGTRFFRCGYDDRFLKVADEFKYVITDIKDMGFIDRRIKVPVILQPVSNDMEIARKIMKALKKNPQKNWYLRMQLHKIMGIR